MYISSHHDITTTSSYRDNINSSLTITDLSPQTIVSLSLKYEDTIELDPGCSDYLDIIGVKGYDDFTKRICRGLLEPFNITTTEDKLIFRLFTDSKSSSSGFILLYTGKAMLIQHNIV